MNLELWFQRFYQHLNGVPEVIVTKGITPMGIGEGPYNGKPNPHAWMSPDNALIYVDNIRDALVKYDPANAQTYQRNAEAYSRRSPPPSNRCVSRLRRSRKINAGWSPVKGVLLSGAGSGPERALPVADQRRSAGHASAGAQGYRSGEKTSHPGGVQRKYRLR
jgi:hypothetical protein